MLTRPRVLKEACVAVVVFSLKRICRPISKCRNYAIDKSGGYPMLCRVPLIALVAVGFCVIPVQVGQAGDDSPETEASARTVEAGKMDAKDKAIAFLREKVINRKVRRENDGTNNTPDGTVAYHFKRDILFANLVESGNGFTFDAIVLIEQKNWDVEDGQKVGDPRRKDRALVLRYHLGQTRSTGELIGRVETLTSSVPHWLHDGESLRMRVKGEELILEKWTNLYSDFFSGGGEYYPGSAHVTYEFYLKDGKLHRSTTVETYEVDPETLEKKRVQEATKRSPDVEVACYPQR